MRVLDLEAMYAPEFFEYTNMASDYTIYGELCVEMQFNNRETVVQTIKNYSIFKSVDTICVG